MGSDHYRRRKRRNQIRQAFAFWFFLLLFLLLTYFLFRLLTGPDFTGGPDLETEPVTEEPAAICQTEETVLSETDIPEDVQTKATEETPEETTAQEAAAFLEESDVYSFLQGPKAWDAGIDWSGSWCRKMLGGQEFGAFGCGLCTLANIYSTLTPYECSPLDMFYYAEEVTKYHAADGVGAIDWPYLKQTLQKAGITSALKRKDSTYEEFRETIAGGLTAIVLVCSANDSTFWQNVSGHYVNIWLYQSSDDTVFLADPGSYKRNRRRIPLSWVYQALKTSGTYQYLIVTSADEEANTWKHDGIREKWNRPSYRSIEH